MLNKKLQFIQKTRPKLKQGDVFYYMIDDKIYFGLVFLTKLFPDFSDNSTIVVVLPNYSAKKLDEFSDEVMVEKIQNGELIAPPTHINKKAWTLGYFKVFTNIDISLITRLKNFRVINSAFVYDQDYVELYSPVNPIGTPDIPDLLFASNEGVFAYEGIEYIIQLGLGLDYDPNTKPYSFYQDSSMQKNFSEQDLPYWYFNSIGKPLVKPK